MQKKEGKEDIYSLLLLIAREGTQAQGSWRGRIRLPAEQGAQCDALSQDSRIMTEPKADAQGLSQEVPYLC